LAAIDSVNREIEVLVEYAAQEGYDFREAAFDEKTSVIRINIALVVVGVVGGILLAWLMSWRIVNPTVRITNTLLGFTIGQSDLDIPETGRRDEIGDIARAAATFRKATEQLREKTEFLQLTEVISRAANEATSVEAAMQIALNEVCAHTGWPVGHAYLLDEVAGDLAPSGIWHLDDAEKFETFRKVTEATRFASGVGLPGRVLASGEPAWIFRRHQGPQLPPRQAGDRNRRQGRGRLSGTGRTEGRRCAGVLLHRGRRGLRTALGSHSADRHPARSGH